MKQSEVIRWGMAVAAALLLSSVSQSTLIVPMSFEEAAKGADVVVLGTVTVVPKLAAYDPTARVVVRRNTVRVDRYLKGQGASGITVVTVGGDFLEETADGPRLMTSDAGGLPDLPAEGTAVLLFLQHWNGPDTYRIYSASHGVVPVEEVGPSKEPSVRLMFRSSQAMPEQVRQRYEEGKAQGFDTTALFPARVPVSLLTTVFEKLNR